MRPERGRGWRARGGATGAVVIAASAIVVAPGGRVSAARAQGVDAGRAPERGLGLPGEAAPGAPDRGLGVSTVDPLDEAPRPLVPRRRRRLLAPAAPRSWAYVPGAEVPPGFRVARRIDTTWFVAGLVGFGFAYGTGVAVAASDVELVASRPGDRPDRNEALYVPLLGSWIALGRARPGGEVGFLVAHGLLQLAGWSGAMTGLLRTRAELVPTLVVTPEQARSGLALRF